MHLAPTVADIFCGAGGLSEGFRQAGCKIVFGSDIDPWALQTFQSAHPSSECVLGPLEKVFSDKKKSQLENLKSGLDFLVGGPPCQAFSINNHQRGMDDKRSGLFRTYLSTVKALRPKWVILENVTGILSIGDGQVVEKIRNGLKLLGYQTDFAILKCKEYGVPQDRVRVIFIGNRIGAKIPWPEKTHGPGLKEFVNVNDAIGDLPSIKNGEGEDVVEYSGKTLSEYQKLMRVGVKACSNHIAPNLSEINLKRMIHIPQGGNWRDIPRRLLPSGMKRAKKSDHTKRYGRLLPDGLASTILTKCDIHWGAYIHPFDDRSLSVREAARFQSFPDRYVFAGPRVHQYMQVGNAVPPILANAIACSILNNHF